MSESEEAKLKKLNKEEGTVPRRQPVILTKGEHDNEKPPTIILRTRDAESRALSPSQPRTPVVLKKEATDAVHPPYQLVQKPNSAQGSNPMSAIRKMKTSVKLIDENLQFCEVPTDIFIDQNDFLVVGVLGSQGVGKSTIMSLLASGDPHQQEKDMCFKPHGLEQHETASHCTNGIDLWVTPNRMLLLDTQPMMSASVLERLSNMDVTLNASSTNPKKYPGSLTSSSLSNCSPSMSDLGLLTNMEGALETHSLQIAAFILSVCHVVIVVQDWFFDPDIIRLIQSAEMLKPPTPTTAVDETLVEYFPHLFLFHNQSSPTEFTPEHIKMMQDVYRSSFHRSKVQIKSGVGVGVGGVLDFVDPDSCGDPVNLFLLPTIRSDYQDWHRFCGHPGFDELLVKARQQILGVRKQPLTHHPLSEKNWLLYASKVWDGVRKSSFFHEYSHLLP